MLLMNFIIVLARTPSFLSRFFFFTERAINFLRHRQKTSSLHFACSVLDGARYWLDDVAGKCPNTKFSSRNRPLLDVLAGGGGVENGTVEEDNFRAFEEIS